MVLWLFYGYRCGIGSFQTVSFDLFKPEIDNLFVLISITLNADSVAPKVSFESGFVS